ncbi:MAG: Sua5/YciO/YrdC/YwlC family protein [Solirubrobacteraceae bacterium]
MSSLRAFERCLAAGGVAVFPADTVYGLACDPANRSAVERLYRLKRRSPGKAAAVMFFDLGRALAALPELGSRTRAGLARLLPGAVTVLLANPAGRFPLACGDDTQTLGLRVPLVESLRGVRRPVLQSSANHAGAPDARRLQDVPELIRAAVDLVIDGGELPGAPSTVLDLRGFEATGGWSVARPGAVGEEQLRAALGWQVHFDPSTYAEMIRADVPDYERLQDELVEASGVGAKRVLELGTGTGETTRRLLTRHPDARLVGIDASAAMLSAARGSLPGERVQLRIGRLEEELPEGSFDLVVSSLCVHHLADAQKADLFARVHARLAPGGRFVLADVVVPEDPQDARAPLTPGFDLPSSVLDQLAWLVEAGLQPRLSWGRGDLAVIVAEAV